MFGPRHSSIAALLFLTSACATPVEDGSQQYTDATGPSPTETGEPGDGDPGDGDGEPDDGDGEPGDGDGEPGDGDGDGDGEPGDGDGDDFCVPGETQPCYTGPAQTENVGPCVGGHRTCLPDGSAFGACEGEVTPVTEQCANAIDDDCNGVSDDNVDADNDGWGACDGDCCDVIGDCLDPELVNPGAYEVDGNMVDDDCNGMQDEVAPACDGGLNENSNNPDHFAMAMELCQFATIDAPLEDKVWGVIDAQIKLPNNQPLAHWQQVGIPTNYGPNQPPANDAMVVLSSGWASDTAASAEWGKGWGVIQNAPAEWIAFHGGFLPKNPGCGQNGKTIRDPSMLELTIRAPTNALSFSVDINFFNAEYPEWVCGVYQDMFVALIDSVSNDNPPDSNIAIYDDGMGGQFPIGVNLARDSGLFRQCAPGSTFGCQGSGGNQPAPGCEGVTQLLGTPYGANDPGCGGGHTYSGGATGWLTMSGNVVPGEVFTIRLFVFDAGENGSGLADALVLIDNWRWELEASAPGVEPQ